VYIFLTALYQSALAQPEHAEGLWVVPPNHEQLLPLHQMVQGCYSLQNLEVLFLCK
jgi:hypothetical protein